MKKIAIAVVVSTALFMSQQAYADDSSKTYTSIKVGGGLNKLKVVDSAGNVQLNKRATGFVGTLALGFNPYNNFRLEAELLGDAGIQSKKNSNVSKAKRQTFAGLMNAYYDITNNTAFTPYIMVGAGVASVRVQSNTVSTTATSKYKSKRNTSFAAQGGVGVAYKLTNTISMDLSYRALHSKNKINATSSINGVVSKLNVKTGLTHIGLIGLRFSL